MASYTEAQAQAEYCRYQDTVMTNDRMMTFIELAFGDEDRVERRGAGRVCGVAELMGFSIPEPEEDYIGQTFTFMGWEFEDREFTDPAFPDIRQGHLISFHKLHNPEPPEAYYAYRGYKPDTTFDGATREYAAAWLIAHWFEHYMGICPCLHGDGPSKFKTAFIETLLS